MSESLAGVTLLAMGNGAPDVLTSVSAAGSEHTGMFFSVGSLSGSGLFVTGVVTAMCIIFSPEVIKVPGSSILRDVCFYMLALITVLIGSIVGELNLYFAVAFFCIYLSYVVVVIIMDKHERKHQDLSNKERGNDAQLKKVTSINQDKESLMSSDEEDDDENYFYEKSASQNVGSLGKRLIKRDDENRKAQTQDSSGDQEQNNGSGEEWSMVLEEQDASEQEQYHEQSHQRHHHHIETGQRGKRKLTNQSFVRRMNIKDEHERPLVLSPKLRAKKILKEASPDANKVEKMNIFKRLIHYILKTPLNFLRRITIPPSDNDSWDRRYASVVPIFSCFFIFVMTGMIDFKSMPHFSFWICLGVACVLSLIIWLTTPYKEEPKRAIIIFAVAAFFLSILWMWSAVNILVDLLGVLGLLLGFNPAFLGMTLLAWGNSFGEVMANSTFARRGLGRMAFTACFAAPLFDFLIGLGLSLTIKKIRGIPPSRFVITDTEAHIPLMAIGGLMLQFIIILIMSTINKFHLKRWQGYVQIGYFALLLTIVSIGAFTFAK
uniref:Sodium/calcium exchanger membrane region domain-containing protein n=1 Tax=Euplotes crassus TaxID=5936 RepID=A0A7S3NTN7_EUPCR|mmetsp:Transcript_30561/g.30042  ORF Transcript_30561/g.30042 Transcript_30561/m.30042 type:complete len:547 (+) Transcript_30561:266-1906(+)